MDDGNPSSRPLEVNDSGNNMVAEETLHDRLPLSCPRCNQSFSDRADLKKHIKCSHPEVIEKPHLCDAYPIAFQYPSQLKQHVQHVHSPDESPNCPKCGFKCKTANNLKQHLKTHEDDRKKFKCSSCGKDYFWKRDLDRHWRDAHACLNNEGNAESDNSQANNEEGSVHTPADQQRNQPRPYPCQHCSRPYTTQRGLSLHISYQHPEVTKQSHQCDVCQKVFPSASVLQRHSEKFHSSEDRPYNCPKPKCTFHCKTEVVFKSHLKIHDKIGEILKCSICEKEYRSKVGLNYHLNTAHDSVSIEGNTESVYSQDHMNQEESQGEASGKIGEAAPGNHLMAVRQGVQDGFDTVDNPPTGPRPVSDTTENAVAPAWWVCYCGNIYSSHEDVKRHCEENHKPDGAIEDAATLFGNAPEQFSQEVSLSCLSTQNEFFTSWNQTTGPSNAQHEASGGITEASPENTSPAVSHGAQNDIFNVDYHPSAESGCTESQTMETEFLLGVWDCFCGNLYASQEDLRRHCDEDHKLDCKTV